QDLERLAVVAEGTPGERRAAVEVAELADLGPGRVDAERRHGEREIHDPDAEILVRIGVELRAVPLYRRGARWRLLLPDLAQAVGATDRGNRLRHDRPPLIPLSIRSDHPHPA